jgi:hypothetical protein
MELLPVISVVTGFSAGALALATAHRQPGKTRQMRAWGIGILAFAALVGVLFLV